jgi:hypothetical protein
LYHIGLFSIIYEFKTVYFIETGKTTRNCFYSLDYKHKVISINLQFYLFILFHKINFERAMSTKIIVKK